MGVRRCSGELSQGVPTSRAGFRSIFLRDVFAPYHAGVFVFARREVFLSYPGVKSCRGSFIFRYFLRYFNPNKRRHVGSPCFVACLPAYFRCVVENWRFFYRLLAGLGSDTGLRVFGRVVGFFYGFVLFE